MLREMTRDNKYGRKFIGEMNVLVSKKQFIKIIAYIVIFPMIYILAYFLDLKSQDILFINDLFKKQEFTDEDFNKMTR